MLSTWSTESYHQHEEFPFLKPNKISLSKDLQEAQLSKVKSRKTVLKVSIAGDRVLENTWDTKLSLCSLQFFCSVYNWLHSTGKGNISNLPMS